MADTSRQVIISPEDLGPKSVFVINDIDLVVPPTQITVQKEDLIYRWRTLRTKAATKIPSGHGRVDVHVTMYFTAAQLLQLHRLIVQFRHSPFCYVDNRYLRETIVPEWPAHQNMAFTMTGIQVMPLIGSSDTWVCELDLVWFNYFPYMHNWLYRQEWQTEPIYNSGGQDESSAACYTVGWSLNEETYERVHVPAPVAYLKTDQSRLETSSRQGELDALLTGQAPNILNDEWGIVLGEYRDKSKKTIFNMEVAHPGVEWDLVPLPDNMMPARIVAQPKHSRIYVRYINLLQRDALYKNFGINVEQDLINLDKQEAAGNKWHVDAFFGATGETGEPKVFGLHTTRVPRDLRTRWVRDMLSHNFGVKFTFHALKEIKFPRGWVDRTEAIKNEAIGNLAKRVANVQHRKRLQRFTPTSGTADGSELAVPVLGGKYRISSPFGPRIRPTTGSQQSHGGVDFAVPEGTPVTTPESGTVVRVATEQDNANFEWPRGSGRYVAAGGNRVFVRTDSGTAWGFMHLQTMAVSEGDRVNRGDVIGLSGNTGGSTGPHLHLSYYPPGVSFYDSNALDPLPQLERILLENYSADFVGPTQTPEEQAANQQLSAEEERLSDLEAAREEAADALQLDEEELDALQEMLELLDSEGWKYFDRDSSILNVWEKLLSLEIAHSGLDILEGGEVPERFEQEGVVLTNISGGLSHIVANLPILSDEFPTQQHLGSIEPQYTFEFAVLDDQGNLEGISDMAQWVQGMRSLLHRNARQFRPVTDGWCVATDTFITRLFGTYTENDIAEFKDGEEVKDLRVRKRTVISSSTAGTVEGSPGLSLIHMTVEETNPYETEVLQSTAPLLEDKEEARKKILQALYDLNFIGKYRRLLLPLLVAQTAGNNTTSPGSEEYGKFHLDVYSPWTMDAALLRGLTSFILEEDGNQYLLIKNDNDELDYLLRGVTDENGNVLVEGIEKELVTNNIGPDSLRDNVISSTLFPKLVEEGGAVDAGLTPGDSSATYYKIPFSESGLAETVAGNESWIANQEAERGITPGFAYGNYTERVYFDITRQISENPDLADVPMERILDYWAGLHEIVNTGNRMLAEELAGGKPTSKIRSDLYDLPFKNRMWQSWQEYLKAFVQITPVFTSSSYVAWLPGFEPWDAQTALTSLERIPGWPTPGANATTREKGDARQITRWPAGAFDMSKPEDAKEVEAIRQIAADPLGMFGSMTGGLTSLDDKLWGYFKSTVGASVSANIDVAAYWRDAHNEAIDRLVNRYMRNLPLQVSLPDFIKSKYNFLFGNILGNFSDESNKVPALGSMHEALTINAQSCGNITALRSTGNPWFQISHTDPFVIHRGGEAEPGNFRLYQQARIRKGGFLGGLEVALPGAGQFASLVKNASGGYLDPEAAVDSLLSSVDEIADSNLKDYLYPDQQIGNKLNSEFQYPVLPGEEDLKVRYIKSLLSTIADDLMYDPAVLRAFGLEGLALADRQVNVQGSECYPDMDLPSHPYYGDSFQVYPDFYMWNIYSDGSALDAEDQQKIYTQMEAVVTNAYQSMKGLQQGVEWRENEDKILGEPSVDDPIHLSTKMTPEATDGQDDGSGPGSSAFEPSKQAKAAEDKFNEKLSKELSEEEAQSYGTRVGDWGGGIRLSATEGAYGAGAGVHYPSRGAPALYGELQQRVNSVENMFGSKAGHANEYIDENNTPEIAGRTQGTNTERPLEYTHSYNLTDLKKLARDSAKDLLSQKMTLRRAYPTFKLFFVEEDEFESRFLNFDDFYTYNAVKEFTVVQSRKLPADHAVITIQNVSGTLDGTKRNTVVDLDYFDKTAEKKLESKGTEGAARGGSPVTQDTAQDQPFGAVVMRPGLNVQLRCGYSNDPDNLHVMLSGRIVDVSWNKTGDLAEIMVQSFGTELIQSVKGTVRDGNNHSYKSTHELLGSMMLEPEVVHFGRWEFGQLFQIGEASDARLDFTDYSREGFMGRFQITGALTKWVVNHPWMTLGVATGLTAASFLPFGRIFGASGRAAGLLGKFGIASPLGRKGFVNVLTAGAKRAGFAKAVTTDAIKAGSRLSSKQAGVLRNVALQNIRSNYNLALKKAGSETFEGVLKARRRAFAKKLKSLNTFDEIVEESAKFERYLQGALFKGQWMAKPWVSGTKAFSWSAIGRKPVSKAFNIFLTGPIKVATAAAAAGLTADLILKPIVDAIYDNTVGAVRKFFTRTQAHLLLSPQDDNLFPPHPKDYMTLDRSDADRRIEELLVTGSRILFQTDDAGLFAYRLWEPNQFLSKKVDPLACSYEIVNSTIWQIFHEMSLRHPGWVYGPRPYGTKFRYTMFFGIPSQRYWARPASNRFIDRMNRLRRYLEGRLDGTPTLGDFSSAELGFRNLYGDQVLEDLRTRVTEGVSNTYLDVRLKSGVDSGSTAAQAYADQLLDEANADITRIVRREMNAIPLREYLRGLELRFVPFRRYHLFTSERDIIWNGVMSSEQAVTNAVDVTYWSEPDHAAGELEGNIQTAVFKAHAFIPENQLRIAPVRWPNCNSYQMAMRYGMGELLHRMRDMYRGEILLLGNPRIRPWDVGILLDSYNDMVGPVEVEQVVHTFSHETGFVTEIKPSALVFGNEISGWPMVEAMKMFAMAINDIEKRYGGLKIEDPENPETGIGFLGTLADLVNLWGAQGADFESFTDEKYKRIFGDEGASLDKVFDGNPPGTETVDGALDDIESYVKAQMGFMGAQFAGIGAASTLAGSVFAGSSLLEVMSSTDAANFSKGLPDFGKLGKAFLKKPTTIVGGAGIVGGLALTAAGFGMLTAASKMDFPSAVWLIGGPILMLHCLRNESIMVVPLMKNGHPIVSGVAYNDPSMLWNNFRGELNRWVDDTLTGTRDMLSLYQRYGSAIWNRLNEDDLAEMTGSGITPLSPGGG